MRIVGFLGAISLLIALTAVQSTTTASARIALDAPSSTGLDQQLPGAVALPLQSNADLTNSQSGPEQAIQVADEDSHHHHHYHYRPHHHDRHDHHDDHHDRG
jgi:hypothetical protein